SRELHTMSQRDWSSDVCSSDLGTLEEVIEGADVFIGVSVADALTPDMVRTMADDSIIFAMANPNPEIMPDAAHSAGAKVVGTGKIGRASRRGRRQTRDGPAASQ